MKNKKFTHHYLKQKTLILKKLLVNTAEKLLKKHSLIKMVFALNV